MEQKDSTGAVFLPVANTVVVGLTPIWRNLSFCPSGRHHEALSSAKQYIVSQIQTEREQSFKLGSLPTLL